LSDATASISNAKSSAAEKPAVLYIGRLASPVVTVAAVSRPETTVAWSSKRTSWMSPVPLTDDITSQETDGNLAASKRIAPSSVWSYWMSNLD
jgi:hypothetical protein